MEAEAGFLGLKEEEDRKSSSKLVPWLNWDEWVFVKEGLFSDSPHSALDRISTWQSRGSVPVSVTLTAFIIRNHRIDAYHRQYPSSNGDDGRLSEDQIAALHCSSIMKLVNATTEKTRSKEWESIAAAAHAIGLQRMLVDVRHEVSHREFPSLPVARIASVKALDWLKSHYWEPQTKAIPFHFQGEEANAQVKEQIKSKLWELAICFKFNQSSNSHLKGKRSKKQITKILKSVLQLYPSFSSEIMSVLLEYLLKALSSSELKENAGASGGLAIENVLADWKLVMLKLSNKEPELLLNLLKKVLNMIETLEDTKSEEDNPNFGISHSREEYLPSLFAWLVGILGKVPSAAESMPQIVLHELLRKCLLVSQLCNKPLMDSALHLAEMMNDSFVLEKVHKLSLFALPNFRHAEEEQSSLVSSPTNISHFEESVHEAAKKLELVKQQIMKNKKPTALSCETKHSSKVWTLSESWNPCPIGMLPRAVGSSGCLPVLDIVDNGKQHQVSERKENRKLIPHSSKRDATLDLELLDNSTVKKMRETNEFIPMERVNGFLMVDGVWKRVTEEELKGIESSVRILV